MVFIRPLARATANGLAIFVGLWGFVVTAELQWLFVAIITVGLINLVLGIQDERQLRAARAVAEKDSGHIEGLVRSVEELLKRVVPAESVPLHVQNLGALSNAQLKAAASSLNAQMRVFDADTLRTATKIALDTQAESNAISSPIEREPIHQRSGREMAEAYLQATALFNERLRPQAVAIWDELVTRLPPEKAAPPAPVIVRYGIAGASPVEDGAMALESLARQLPD